MTEPTGQEWRILSERLATLWGDRGDGRNKAMRAAEGDKLLEQIAKLRVTGISLPDPQSETVTGAPTSDDFNKLVADVHALFETIGKILKTRT